MMKLFLLLLSCVSLFAQRTPLKVNGTIVQNPNLTNTASITWSVVGANVSGTAAGGAYDAAANEAANETVLDLQDLQGAVTDGQIPAAIARDSEVAAAYQPLDADLTDLADGTLTGSKVDFSTVVNSFTLWDSSQASRTITFGLAGATDPGLTAANNVLTFSTPVTIGDSSAASVVLASGLSGATDPTLTFANALMTASTAFTIGGNLTVPTGSRMLFTGRGGLVSTADGSFALQNNAQTDFGMLYLGNATASFPALKRSSTNLLVKLADDSAFADVGLRRVEFNQVTAGGTPSTDTARIYAKDSGGTAEIYALDEAGNESLQSPHPDDAPANMEDRQDGLQDEFAKSANYYVGKIEWINQTRMARFVQRLLNNTNFLNSIGETNLASMSTARRRIYHVETFADYNTRMGTTNLVQLTWGTVQNQKQSDYDAARDDELVRFNTPWTNEVGQVFSTNTNVVVRPEIDIRKPKPAWMP